MIGRHFDCHQAEADAITVTGNYVSASTVMALATRMTAALSYVSCDSSFNSGFVCIYGQYLDSNINSDRECKATNFFIKENVSRMHRSINFFSDNIPKAKLPTTPNPLRFCKYHTLMLVGINPNLEICFVETLGSLKVVHRCILLSTDVINFL